MNIQPLNLLRNGAYIAIAILALRGATAFYTQYTTAPIDRETATTTSTTTTTKAQRLQHATQLLSGMGKTGTVKETFSAPDGSTGIVIQTPNEGTFIGWMADGIDALWVGAKFDAQGRNMTQQEMIARGYAKPTNTPTQPTNQSTTGQTSQAGQGTTDPMTSQSLLKAVLQSPGFTEGTSGPTWTVYIDPNCIYCTQLWRNLRNPIAAGQLRVHWAPVAVIAPNSAAQSAALLQSDKPLTLLTQHGTGAGHLPNATITPGTQQQIEANNAMLRALNAGKTAATPTIVIPAKDGARVITGLPPDINALF